MLILISTNILVKILDLMHVGMHFGFGKNLIIFGADMS